MPAEYRIKVLFQDPFFDLPCDDESPMVSSTADSRLIFAAVKNRQHKYLEKCRANVDRFHSLEIRKSLAENINPLQCAIKSGDVESLRILANRDKIAGKQRIAKPR